MKAQIYAWLAAILLVSGLFGWAASGTAGIDGVAPTTPASLTATGDSRQVKLAWTGSTDDSGSVSYRIWRSGTLIVLMKPQLFGNAYTAPDTRAGIEDKHMAKPCVLVTEPLSERAMKVSVISFSRR